MNISQRFFDTKTKYIKGKNMKKILIVMTVFVLLGSIPVSSQSKSLSVGLVESIFANRDGENKMSEIKNPAGTGILVGYQINKEVALGLTTEFYNQKMENISGNEKGYRTHLSFVAFPLTLKDIGVYVSAGVVYNHTEYTLVDKVTNNNFYGRFGAGVNVYILQNFALNFDGGLYHDCSQVQGWSGSVGFRYILPQLF